MPHHERTSSEADVTASGPVVSEFADDPDYRELIGRFVASAAKLRRELQGRLERGDIEGLRVLAHQLKGAAGGYGFPQLTAIAAEAEAACEASEGARIIRELERLLEYLGRITV